MTRTLCRRRVFGRVSTDHGRIGLRPRPVQRDTEPGPSLTRRCPMDYRKSALKLLTASFCLLASTGSWADFMNQEIKNNAQITTANDLTLVFTKGVTGVEVFDRAGNKAGEQSVTSPEGK